MTHHSINASSTGPAAIERAIFDNHLDTCHECKGPFRDGMCTAAEALWRKVCIRALIGGK